MIALEDELGSAILLALPQRALQLQARNATRDEEMAFDVGKLDVPRANQHGGSGQNGFADTGRNTVCDDALDVAVDHDEAQQAAIGQLLGRDHDAREHITRFRVGLLDPVPQGVDVRGGHRLALYRPDKLPHGIGQIGKIALDPHLAHAHRQFFGAIRRSQAL